MVRICGASLGLFAFAVAIFLGLSAGNPAEVILSRAIQALLLFCMIGLLMGWIAWRVLDDHALAKQRELFGQDEAAEPGAPENADEGSTRQIAG